MATERPRRGRWLALALLGLLGTAHAQLYQGTGEHGEPVFSDRPLKPEDRVVLPRGPAPAGTAAQFPAAMPAALSDGAEKADQLAGKSFLLDD
jgi:hypothetical protein